MSLSKSDLEPHFKLPAVVPKGQSGETSVLALVDATGKELSFLLTKRTQLVETHKGQISFPGGYWEHFDADILQTALRETEEEIGILRKGVRPVGQLEKVKTRGEIWITPWVAFLEQKAELKLQKEEVEKVIYLPLEKLIKQGLKKHKIQMQTFSIMSPGIEHEGELIWGATAKILDHFLSSLPIK